MTGPSARAGGRGAAAEDDEVEKEEDEEEEEEEEPLSTSLKDLDLSDCLEALESLGVSKLGDVAGFSDAELSNSGLSRLQIRKLRQTLVVFPDSGCSCRGGAAPVFDRLSLSAPEQRFSPPPPPPRRT